MTTMQLRAVGLAVPSQVYVPARAVGCAILDNGGDRIAECFTPDLASRLAELINRDAFMSPGAERYRR